MEIGAGNVPMETPGRLHRKSLPGGGAGKGGAEHIREPYGLHSDRRRKARGPREKKGA